MRCHPTRPCGPAALVAGMVVLSIHSMQAGGRDRTETWRLGMRQSMSQAGDERKKTLPQHSKYPEDNYKVFVGGIAHLSEEDIKNYFTQNFGELRDLVIKRRPDFSSRGFGFIIFHRIDSAAKAIQMRYVNIAGKRVEIKEASNNRRNSDNPPSQPSQPPHLANIQAPAGYPPQFYPQGYPPQPAGYPPQPGGYPPQQGGYPPQQVGYPPQQGGYPPQQGGYPPLQGGYPPQEGGYPPQQRGYPPQQGGYPPQQGGYPPQQGGYPPQQGGYPPQQGGYPPQQGGYPMQQRGYEQQQGGYPSAQGGYSGGDYYSQNEREGEVKESMRAKDPSYSTFVSQLKRNSRGQEWTCVTNPS
ncbi:hypothetical protein AAMO2058_000017800 [Amorphochlora amoebiformis]